ncbi:DUF4335 domain-containing protein [Moorena producens JHB]|uniref:DUF4335 domain-containing protein n=1 Tax=Moorena producens (strain JHB) TaxID=1454205 RepID=A0A1D9FUB7_MOOP1|nr:DUF4335 domain-containing protein [Moorena producens]AOY78972.1 DUF4335 domain-containing protein [Moorena producens JHB]
MTNIVLRRYTPPTCSLSISANRSPLSRWVGQSVVKKLRFELRFDDPRKPEEQQVTLQGNAEDLDVLYEAVDGYVQHFLEPSGNQLVAPGDSSAEVTPLSVLTLPTPKAENATAVPTQPIHLQSKGLLSHSLFLGKLANEESGSVVDLSATQLFDLATALDEYAAEVVSLPKLNQPSWKPESSGWMRTAASMVLAVGVTAAVIKLLEKPQPVEQAKTLTTAQSQTTALDSSKMGKRVISQVPPAPSTPIPTPSVPPRLSPGTKLPPPPPVKPPSPPVRTPPPPPVKPPSPPLRTPPPIASRPNSRPLLKIVPPPARTPDSPKLSAASSVASSAVSPVASSVTSPVASSAVSPAAPGASNGEAPVSEASKTNVPTADANTQPKPTPPSPIAVVQTVSELPVIKPAPSPTDVATQDSSRESLSIPTETVVIPEAESSISSTSTSTTSISSTSNVAVQAIPAPQQNVSTLKRGPSTSRIIDQAVPGLNVGSSPVIDQAVPGLNVPNSSVSDPLNSSEPTVANQISQNTLFDKISQVAEARRYFQERWQPPEGLQKTLNYSLWLNNNGTIRRIIPLGQAAKTYIDNAPIPLIGETFVSPLEGEGMPKIRVLLHPDGKVQTLLEGMN